MTQTYQLDASGQRDLVRRGEIAHDGLVRTAIRRIEAVDPSINAVIHPLFEEALDACPPDPGALSFGGVPVLLKDIGSSQRGVPRTQGNAALRDIEHRAPSDSPLGRKFREAGLVTLGVTNMPEFGLLCDTQPLAYGPTRNPWDRSRSVGGSSGGSAAAVAAGMVPLAKGGDGAGSIRIPAAWCGLVGLKVSRGRLPQVPGSQDLCIVDGVVTRSVRDTALFLDVCQGSVPGARYSVPPPEESYGQIVADRTFERPLRIGVLDHGPDYAPLHPEHTAAIVRTASLLEELGHEVSDRWPPALLEQPPPHLAEAQGAAEFELAFWDLEELIGRPVMESDVEPWAWSHRRTAPVDRRALLEADSWQADRAHRLASWWVEGEFDVLLTPTMHEPPPLLEDLAKRTIQQIELAERQHIAFLQPFNVSGQPAVSVPAGFTADGLPIGVQLAARFAREDVLLGLAAQLEEASPWVGRWMDTIDGELTDR